MEGIVKWRGLKLHVIYNLKSAPKLELHNISWLITPLIRFCLSVCVFLRQVYSCRVLCTQPECGIIVTQEKIGFCPYQVYTVS